MISSTPAITKITLTNENLQIEIIHLNEPYRTFMFKLGR
jgi:hypothetical protein